MDNFDGKVVHAFPQEARKELRAYLQDYEGETLAHIRVFRVDKLGVARPTKKGIAVPLGDLEQLAVAVVALLAEAGRAEA
jgi:hypothetical protein